MKRRLFLSRLAVASSAVAALSVGVCASDHQVMLIGHEYKWQFEVNGSTEDCRKFVEAFQTHLWPEWKTHPNAMARQVLQKCYASWPPGVGRVSKEGKQCQEALQKTLAQFGNQVHVVKYGM